MKKCICLLLTVACVSCAFAEEEGRMEIQPIAESTGKSFEQSRIDYEQNYSWAD